MPRRWYECHAVTVTSTRAIADPESLRPVDRYVAQLAAVYVDRGEAMLVAGVLLWLPVVRSICVWRLAKSGKHSLRNSFCRNPDGDYWIGSDGEYEAVMAHEPVLMTAQLHASQHYCEGVLGWVRTLLPWGEDTLRSFGLCECVVIEGD
jgi:hypothetical protein